MTNTGNLGQSEQEVEIAIDDKTCIKGSLVYNIPSYSNRAFEKS